MYEQIWGRNPRMEHWTYVEQYKWLMDRWKMLDGCRLIVWGSCVEKSCIEKKSDGREYINFYKKKKQFKFYCLFDV